MTRKRKIIGAAIGDCVHVAGVYNFLRLAESQGYETVFLGPAVSVERLVNAIKQEDPLIVGVSYRLTPEAAERLFSELKETLSREGLLGRRFVFGGTPPVARVAEPTGLFERVFDGSEDDEATIGYLRSGGAGATGASTSGAASATGAGGLWPDSLVERIMTKHPYPLIRHHFGLPSLAATIEGARELAESRLLDVISIGPDQNAQESFFRPEEMDPGQDGAGGVPVRSADDFRRLYEASRTGNYPLMRSYSGTRDQIRMAKMLKETINLAWGAVPLFWYNVLDGRSSRMLEDSIAEAQRAMAWHANNGIPVEVNEAHHWSLRDAPDSVAVAAAYLAAYNAKAAGVRDYVAQFMFNTPPSTSPAMDVAKMLAKLELMSSLEDEGFRIWRQTRTGLLSYPTDLDVAKGQLGSSVLVQMALRPHIVHVVSFVEADHAATPADIIDAVKIARGAIRQGLLGLPDMASDPRVAARKDELVAEARVILDAIREIARPGCNDPWTDPVTLGRAVRTGLLDAPHLAGNPVARGKVVTRMVDGACRAWDPGSDTVLDERDRVRRLLAEAANGVEVGGYSK
ncbi:MAG: cobalamin B12-binding domain-containing protein [Firmicutes bacterium]|nr:cobalamin B12-binding domain-containing protein [Bacillota bacterium]